MERKSPGLGWGQGGLHPGQKEREEAESFPNVKLCKPLGTGETQLREKWHRSQPEQLVPCQAQVVVIPDQGAQLRG